MSHFMVIVLLAYKISLLLKLLCNQLPSFSSHDSTVLLRTVVVKASVWIQDIDGFKVVSLSTLPVIRVMGRSNLYHTCSKSQFDEGVCNDWNLPVCKRKGKCLSHNILISFILWIHSYSHVSEHGLWSCGGHSDPSGTV